MPERAINSALQAKPSRELGLVLPFRANALAWTVCLPGHPASHATHGGAHAAVYARHFPVHHVHPDSHGRYGKHGSVQDGQFALYGLQRGLLSLCSPEDIAEDQGGESDGCEQCKRPQRAMPDRRAKRRLLLARANTSRLTESFVCSRSDAWRSRVAGTAWCFWWQEAYTQQNLLVCGSSDAALRRARNDSLGSGRRPVSQGFRARRRRGFNEGAAGSVSGACVRCAGGFADRSLASARSHA